MPGVTELGAAAHGWPGHRAGRATDPDRRVRPLRGTGGERGAGEARVRALVLRNIAGPGDRKSTRLNSSHTVTSYAVFCLKKKNRALTASKSPLHRRR